MKKHEGVKYQKIKDGSYKVVWPSGFSSIMKADSDDEVEKNIEELKNAISKKN